MFLITKFLFYLAFPKTFLCLFQLSSTNICIAFLERKHSDSLNRMNNNCYQLSHDHRYQAQHRHHQMGRLTKKFGVNNEQINAVQNSPKWQTNWLERKQPRQTYICLWSSFTSKAGFELGTPQPSLFRTIFRFPS